MNQIKDPIGSMLKAKRKERGLSVPEFAVLIGIPADRIYKWEAGKSTPKFEDRQFLSKWINSEDWKNVPHGTVNNVMSEPAVKYGSENRQSLERSIELLLNDRREVLGVIKDLTAILKQQYHINQEDRIPAGTPEPGSEATTRIGNKKKETAKQ